MNTNNEIEKSALKKGNTKLPNYMSKQISCFSSLGKRIRCVHEADSGACCRAGD